MKNKRILTLVICLAAIALVALVIVISNNKKPNGSLSEINLPGQTVTGNDIPTATATILLPDTPTESAALATPNTEPTNTETADTPTETSFPSETPTSTPIDNQQENPRLYSYEETTQKIKELGTTLIETEKQGFEAALSNLNNGYSYYNLAIARWYVSIASGYYVSDTAPGYKVVFKDKYPKAIDYLNQKQPSFSPVYLGASNDDHVYFIGICQRRAIFDY